MALLKEECGHPTEWNLRLVQQGTVFTYCMGCIVEKLGLDNLEAYSNPYIKELEAEKPKSAPKKTTKNTKK